MDASGKRTPQYRSPQRIIFKTSSRRSVLNIRGDQEGSQCNQSSVPRGIEENEVGKGEEVDRAESYRTKLALWILTDCDGKPLQGFEQGVTNFDFSLKGRFRSCRMQIIMGAERRQKNRSRKTGDSYRKPLKMTS